MAVRATSGSSTSPPRWTARMAFASSFPADFLSTYPDTPALSRRRTYSRSSYWERMRILARRPSFFISSAASIPPSPGMAMSIRTRSGSSRSTSARACNPSAASPTTSMSGWSCSRARTPSRRMAWSSAMTTLILGVMCASVRAWPAAGSRSRLPSCPALSCHGRRRRGRLRRGHRRHRDPHLHPRPLPRGRLDPGAAAEDLGPLADAHEPPRAPALALGDLVAIESEAVVLDVDPEHVVLQPDLDQHGGGLGVARHVAHGLLA